MEDKVVLGIVTFKGKILLVRRKPTEGTLLWQFPGGTVEEGETFEEAVVRELKEETGIDAKVLKNLGERIHPYTKKYMAYIACEYLGGELSVSDDDLDLAEWADICLLDQYFTTPLYDKVADYLATVQRFDSEI